MMRPTSRIVSVLEKCEETQNTLQIITHDFSACGDSGSSGFVPASVCCVNRPLDGGLGQFSWQRNLGKVWSKAMAPTANLKHCQG
jgi:hypothetical protein